MILNKARENARRLRQALSKRKPEPSPFVIATGNGVHVQKLEDVFTPAREQLTLPCPVCGHKRVIHL